MSDEVATKVKHQQTEQDRKAKGLFPTLEAAKAVPADNPNYETIKVTVTKDISFKAGDEFFTWATSPVNGLRNLGLSFAAAESAEKANTVTVLRFKRPDEMTPEELERFTKEAKAELKRRQAASTVAHKGAATESETLPPTGTDG